jgi:flagellar M-ring protein FliF
MLRNLGAGRLMVIGILAAGFVAFFVFLTSRLTSPTMALLYSGLDPADASKIVAKLDSMAVPYKLEAGGTQVHVPNDQVAKLRMTVAQEGLPSGGSMGYEIFDRSESLGTSNFVLNIHHLRALEGELSRTIQSLNYVRRARVHLVLPRRELFSRTAPEPSASVVLAMQGSRRLTGSEVQAIQQLVAAAVPNLQPGHISIVDGQGTLLSKGRGKEAANGTGAEAGMNESIRKSYESEMARTIEELLERTVGPSRVRAEVTATMDFDRISTTTETYDPDGQVVRSTQSVEESSASKDGQAGAAPVSVTSSLPSAGQAQNKPPAPPEAKNTTNSTRTEETVNFEISKTTKTHVRESGALKQVSVAVLVDGTYTDESGKRVYRPRSAEEMALYKKLVETSIGFSPQRGDKVEVINLRFAKGEEIFEEDPRPLFGLGKNDYIRIAELLILAIVSILVILLVVRPLIKRILDALPDAIASSKNLINESVAAAANTALPGGGGMQALPSAPGPLDNIDMASIEGRVRDSTVRKIGEIVDKHPEEAVSIIRNWMYQEN